MNTIKKIVGCGVAVVCCVLALGAQAVEKAAKWSLPGDWDASPAFGTAEGYAIIRAEGAMRGVGEVGAPDLPAFRYTVTMPKGGTLKDVAVDAEWKAVDLGGALPSPVAAPVTSGQRLVYPAPGPAYAGTYPAAAAYAAEAMLSGNKLLQPVVITPFRWDGATKTLYVATKLDVTITYTEPRTLKLTTSSVEPEGEVLILSPHDFVPLWQGYAAFRKSTAAGQNFRFIVKDTKEIYDYPGLTDREKTDYALALHHYIETNFYKAASCDKQYIILGASPAKTATFNPNTMIPKRDFFGDSGTSTHDYDQAGDMYYGCMERLNNGQIDPAVEVWDYGNDGVYWAAQNTAPYNFDPNNCVDWTMEIAVTRVPLLERSVETLNGNTIEKTAAQMMDAFTNRIAWAESAAFETADRGKAYVGGNENEGNQKGGKDERYTGERQFFDGIANMFDPSRNGKITSDEWGPRDRIYNIMGKVQPQRNAKIIANNINNTDINGAYSNRGDLATFYSHGDWREYGNLSASRAYQGGGFYAVYATSFSCMSGKYDTSGNGVGITNALCFGEAPIVAPVKENGALVTLTSARDGWSSGFGTLSMYLDELFLKALYGLADGVPMNAAQAGKYAHNTYASSAYGTTSAHGSVLGHAILCGDPLIKVFMMPDRTTLTGYSRNLSVSTASGKTFDIADDVAAARAAFSDAGNQTLTLQGAGKFRTTDTFTVTNVANLVWDVAGGAGRNGITFAGAKGNLTLGGTATRYFGPKLTNVGKISVTGGNVTLDFDTTACAFDELEFVAQSDTTAYPNILRTRKEGFIPAAQTIPVVNSALKLQTINVGGSNAALKETPLFHVTNGVLTVESNPYWGTEYFVRPTFLSNAKLLGEYADFGLGRPDSNGYDIYVDGTSEIGGSTPIKVTGELRLHLEDAATTLTLTNALANGHNGAAGSVVVSGAGKVILATSPTLTGGMTIEGGVALELPKIPLTSGGTITLESGAKLLLPEPSSSGIYNVYSGDAKLVLGDGVKVYKASAPDTEISGRFVNGNFIPNDAVIYWKVNSGTWQNNASVTTCWTNSNGTAVGFTNGQSVFFGPVASSVSVTSSGVTADYVEINAPGKTYTFNSSSITPNLLSIMSDATFNAPITNAKRVSVTGGTTTLPDSANTSSAKVFEVADGGSLKMMTSNSKLSSVSRTIRAIRFSFSDANNANEKVAIQELRLFNDSTRFMLPQNTIIEDIAGQKIRIDGTNGDAHTCTWLANEPTDKNQSLFALVDGILGNQNKWWASQSSKPTWFTITFPSGVSVNGYNLRTADHTPRNPKAWTVEVSDDGVNFEVERKVSGVSCGDADTWLSGDGSAKAYYLTSSGSKLRIRNGGTVYAAGIANLDVVFDEGSAIRLTGDKSKSLYRPSSGYAKLCTLTLPENGGVYVSAQGVSASADSHEVLWGYGLTEADKAKFTPADNVTLSISGGALYATVDSKKCSPFVGTITSAKGATPSWTGLSWTDRYGDAITWDSSLQYSTSATATLNVESLPANGATLNLNYAATLGTLKLTGGSTETLILSWSAACVPAVIDLTEYDGKVVLAPGSNLASATEIIANENTEINGTGIAAKLTIGAGKKATVEYPWSGTKTVASGGTVAYDNNTSSSVLALGNLKIDGATVELAGTHTIDGSFAVNVDNTKMVSSGTVSTEANDNEVILSNNAKSIFEVKDGELILQGRVRIRKDSVGKLILSGGEIKAAGNGFLYPGGGYGGDSMDFTITGGKFTAGYNPYSAKIDAVAAVNISGGEFAPANLWYTDNGNKPSSDNTSTTLNNSGFAVNMWGGTFSAPTGVPNWLPINVTAGSANLGPQNAGTTTIRSLLTIDGGATLNITAGTISFAGSGALKGTGTLAIGSGATFTTAYGSLSNNVSIASGGTLNLTGAALTESGITITMGTFSKADGATLQINGTALDTTQWTIEGNRIVKRQSGQYGPLMSERWHQHNPFNWFAAYVGGDLTPCGCVAMGVGQMFHYYRWPVRTDTVTEAAATYQTGGNVTQFPLAVDGKNPFLWDEMRDYASACTRAGQYESARMILWCDALAKMCFQPGGSNTALYYVPESVSYWYEKGEELLPSAGDHRERLKTELAAGRPVQTTIDGHQVVIDGWRSSDNKFHVNWGQEDSDSTKTTWYDVTQSTLGSWSVSSFWVGITPRKMAQIQMLPKLGSSTVTLAWDVPAVHTNAITGFTVKDYTCADAVTNYTIPGTNELSYTRADYYPIPGVYGATANATFSCTVYSSNTKALVVDMQVRYDGGPWQTFATPELSTEESYEDEGKGVYVDKTKSIIVNLNLGEHAGKAAEFRIKTTRTGNSFAADYTGPFLRLCNCSWTNVHAPVAAVAHAAGATARSLEISGLTAGSYHSFTVTPTIEGAIESEPMGMRVAAANQEIPALPEILRIETMGSPITDGFVREVKPGAIVFFLKGSETVTGVSAAISHPGLVAANLVRVKPISQGNWYAIEIDASEQITVNSRMILTIEATDAYENRVVKDLMLIVSNTIEDDNDGQLMSALDQENAVIVPPDVTNHLESTFDYPLVGAGTVVFNNTLPEGYTLINSLQNSFAWHGTVRMVDCPTVEYKQTYKNDNSTLIEESSPTPPEPEPEPDPNQMYYNKLSAGDEEIKVARGTYGTAIEVPANGYYATAFDTLTKLETTASATIGGNYANIIKDGTYIDTHTVVGWFKIGALPTGSNLTTIYLAKSCNNSDNGYKVAVDASGKILVGKTNYDSGNYSWNGSNYKTTDAAVVTADTWFHLAIAIAKTTNEKSVTPAVFVNGEAKSIASGTFAGNLNGNSCTDLMVGAGVTAAGIYVDTTALSDVAKVASFATNAYYLVEGEQPIPEPEPASPVLVWEGNSTTATKTLSLTVEKGKEFTLIVHMTNTTDTAAGSYIIGKIGAGQTITPFCVAADEYTSFTTGGAIPNNSVSYDEKKSGGWWCGVGSRSNSGNATWNEEKIGDEVSKLSSIYVAFSGTVNADGTIANYVRMVFAHKTSGVDYTLSNTSSSLTISDALDTMNVNSSVDTLAFKVYLDHHVRTVDQIKQAIADIENPPGPTPTNAAKIGDTEYATVAAAITAVTDGQTITLLKNVDENLSDVAKAFTLAFDGHTLSGTLGLANTGVVTLDLGGGTLSSTLTGSGTLVYDATLVTTFPTTAPTGLTENAWTGTVWFKGYDVSGKNLTGYGNGASKVKMSGCYGYLNNTGTGLDHAYVLELSNESFEYGFNVNNGWSYYMKFAGLTGDGTLKMTKPAGQPVVQYIFTDASQFQGSINIVNDTKMYYSVVLGNFTYDSGDAYRNRIIVKGSASVASGKTWTAAGGILVDGKIGGAGTLASNTTLGDGAEIDNRNGTLNATGTLTFGASTKVRVTTTPTADVKIISKSGTTAGDISTTVSVYVGSGETPETREYKLAYKTDGVYLIPGESPYAKFANNPGVLTYNGAGTFHTAYFVLFDIVGGTNTTTSYNGNASSGTIIPGQTAVIDKSWKVFSANSNTDNGKYVAPGYVLRFASGIGTAQAMDADFDPISIGGMVVESGATGWSFVSNKGNAARATQLGDNRATGGVPTWFVFNESFAFNRYSSGYPTLNTLTLWGEINFEIAEGKTVSLNTDTSKGCPNPQLDTTTHAQLKMHGAGTLAAKLNATGAVTLDYSNIPLARETAYISGTLTINDSTVIKLPEGLAENTPFRMATTLSGATSGERTIWIGETEVVKYVTFDAANGTISYADAVPYKTLGWDAAQSAWTNAQGVATAVDNTCILNAKDGDVITFSSAVTPHQFNMPESGTVTLGTGGNLMNFAITVPSGATLALGWNSADAYAQVISGAGAVDITGAMVQLGANNTFTGALTVQDGGYLKMGVYTCLGNANAATVEQGGTFDINGKNENGGMAITLNGGALVNNGSSISYGNQQLGSITLTANSTVGGTGNFGLVTSGYNATTLALDGHTLTKTGSAGFCLCNTTVDGTGTFVIESGTLEIYNRDCSFTAGTLLLSGGTLTVDGSRTFTLSNLTVHSGTISGSGSISGLTTLKGSVDFSAFAGTVALANTVTIGTDGVDDMVTLGNASTEGKTLDVVGGTLNLAKDGTQRVVGALTLASGSTLMVSTNTTQAAVSVDNALNLNGVNVAVAGVLPEVGGKVYLLGANSITGTGKLVNPGAWTVAVEGNTLTATKKPSTYITPGDEGEVEHASEVNNSLDISKELAIRVTKGTAIEVTDASTSEQVVEAMNQTGANGYKVWESAVLGLSPTNANDQLVITPIQTSNANKVTLQVPEVNVDTTTGADVTFCFWSKEGDGEWKEVSDGAVESGEEKELDLPASGVKYYQLRTTIKTQAQKTPTVIPSANIVASGMPLTTGTGSTKTAASLGTKTLDAAAESFTVELMGAGVYEGQEYHLEVTEGADTSIKAGALELTTSAVDSNSSSHFAVVAKAAANKSVTFYFGREVPSGTTCKLTMISAQGNGNIAVRDGQGFTGIDPIDANVIVSARMGFLPHEDGIATAQAPDMPQQYRIPAIATDGKGEVIACYDCRYGKSDLGATWSCPLNTHGTVYSGIDIAENYSSDNGRTFGGSYLAVDVANMRDQTGEWVGGYDNRNNSAYIVKERDIGDVCLLFDPAGNGGDGLYWMMGITGGGLSTTGTGGDKADVVLYTRTRGEDSKWVEWNNGKGSSDPLQYRSVKWQILDSLGVTTATLGQGFLEGPGHGIVTTKSCTIKGANVPAGTLVFPIQCFLSGGTKSGAAYSTDHGATWKATALTDTDSAPQENCVMELDDGTWYMCTKCNGAGYYRTYRYNHSTDAWVKVENGAYCPAAREGSCLRMGVDSNGKGRYAICHARNDRANIVVYFGVDTTTPGETPSTSNKGISWDWDHYVTIHKENTSGGYSSMCMVDDTTLGILYESACGAANDGGTDVSGCRMYFTRIDVSDKVVPPAK